MLQNKIFYFNKSNNKKILLFELYEKKIFAIIALAASNEDTWNCYIMNITLTKMGDDINTGNSKIFRITTHLSCIIQICVNPTDKT